MELTATERRVLNRLIQGDASLAELTADLGMSRPAVSMHISRIRDKAEDAIDKAIARDVIMSPCKSTGGRFTIHPEVAAVLRC
jgi:DNA-binding CsgD family transcriptional regulator